MSIDVTTERLIPLSRAARQLGCTWAMVRQMVQLGLLEAVAVPGPKKKTKIKTSLEACARCVEEVEPIGRVEQPRRNQSAVKARLKQRGIL